MNLAEPRKPLAVEAAKPTHPNEELFASVLDTSFDGVMAFDAIRDSRGTIVDFRWTLVNRAASNMVGRSPAELLGQSLLTLMPGNYEDGLFHRYKRVVDAQLPTRFEHYYQHEGLEHWFLISAVPLADGFSVTFADITPAKLLEKRLRERESQTLSLAAELAAARQAAESANAAKTAFVNHISHEIRTPLTAILGFADIIDDPATPRPELLEAAQTIRKNSHSLLTLVNDVLDLAKIESGHMSIHPRPTHLQQSFSDLARLFRPLFANRDVTLHFNLIDGTPLCLHTDPIRLQQILINLIANALKFTACGSVTVVARPDSPSHLAIDVIDTGPGIHPDVLPRLFTPFTQSATSHAHRFASTGIGLTISKHLAQLLGGDLTVQSEPNSGSTFTLTLPIPTPIPLPIPA